MIEKTFTDATELPAVGFPVQQPVRPDPERVAFEAWLNPGNHTSNVSPWAEYPGRYQQDTHQLAWLAWRACRKQERERWQARVEQAFRDGYWARETYNDSEVSDADEKWASAKAGLLKA